MGRYRIRKSLQSADGNIVVITGTYKFDDIKNGKMPYFVDIEYMKEREFKDIHIKRKNIINPEVLTKNKKYILIGRVYSYTNKTHDKTNYSLTDITLIPVDED